MNEKDLLDLEFAKYIPLIEEARKNASRIVNDALLRAEKIEIKADTLERNMRIFKKKLKLVVEQQLTVIDEIEDLDLK